MGTVPGGFVRRSELLVESRPPEVAVDREPIRPCPWLAAWTLCRREWVRFIRQPNRVFGAIGQPLIFWVLFGAGLGQAGGVTYKEYFFPGALVLILLFTAIFATISIIEDRREGFLQSVLVAPLPRWSMVLGKILGGTLIAVAQGTLFVLLGYTLGFQLGPLALLAVVGWMFLVSLGLTALGFVLAWRMDSTQGFHAVMSVLLMPMWLLSGAFFPAKSNWLGYVIAANPLTYGVAGLRHLLYWSAGSNSEAVRDLPSFWVCLPVTLIFCVLMFMLAWKISARRTTGDLL
jgi:ABC-2 type transport system permease protein